MCYYKLIKIVIPIIGELDINMRKLNLIVVFNKDLSKTLFCIRENFYGILKHDVNLIEEKNKLEWVTINDELLNNEKFAGNYNIPHIIRQIKTYLKNGNNIL